mmetsp:Transcript_40194/g.129085  ORF Transcript_40194/g.129085 Transcript_40194/m.129085 type:complete len:248 (-) Transcript_40194:84-827(-)
MGLGPNSASAATAAAASAAGADAGAGGGSPAEGEVADFVVTIRPTAVSRRRGQGSFAASKGIGSVEVKCTRQLDLDVAISVVVGNEGQPVAGFPPFWHQHNFAQKSIFHLEHDCNFLELCDKTKHTLCIGLRIESRVPSAVPTCTKLLGGDAWNLLQGLPSEHGQDAISCVMNLWPGVGDACAPWNLAEGLPGVPVTPAFVAMGWALCPWVQAFGAAEARPADRDEAVAAAPATAVGRERSPGREFE